MTLRFRSFAAPAALLLLLTVAPAAIATAKSPPAHAHAWPQATVDIPADAKVRFGVLPNGMRYAIQRNATPTGQAALRLRIDAGSMMETDAERGLAHFLEHMTFNGSKRVPEGEMVKILERHGLAFGADTNAQTSWDETVYQLDLPRADADTVNTGLMLLREGASELTIDPAAIDRERGVVLSEERTRDTPALHVFKSGMDFFLEGQLASRRLPIGLVPVIQHADHNLIAGFYRKYYRPGRAVLVAVGDFDVDVMEAKIKARFGDWTGQGPPGPEPAVGRPVHRGAQTHLIVEPGAPLAIQMEWVRDPDASKDSRAKRGRKQLEQLGLAVLNRRLERIARSGAPPFIAAQSYKEDVFHSADATVLAVSARPDQWRGALAAVDQEQRRLVQYGVRQDELDREISELRVQFQAAVAAAATRRTPQVADDIVGTLDDKEVYTSPAEDLALFEAEVKGLKAETISAVLHEEFSGQGPLVFMASPQAIDGGEKALADAYAAASSTPVAAPSAEAALKWPYANFGAPGKVAEQTAAADLGTSFVRFDNGVRLTVKPTKFRDNQVLVRVRLGRGLLDRPSDTISTTWAGPGALVPGGLKDLAFEDLERILAANIYGAEFSVGEDAVVLQGVTQPKDLPVQMQVLAAYATAPGFRPEAFLRMQTYAATLHDQMEATPQGVMSRDLSRLMHGGDQRFAFPTPADIAASSPAAFHAQIAPELADGQIEVVIVGDVTVEQATALTATTFGALPARPASSAPAAQGRTVTLPAPSAQPVMLSHKGRADQAIVYAEWPTEDFFTDPQKARTLRVLAQVVENRLVDDLREAAGDTYSPQAGANASLVFPHYGYVSATVEVPPAKIPDFYADLAKISASLRTTEITADELERARKPLIEGLLKARQTNEYWLEQLSGVQAEPRKLDAIRGVLDSLGRADPAALEAAANLYLRDDKLWKLEIKPVGP